VIRALGERGIASKAYLPCIHLQPFYRERFGFREGMFPVAERISGRSLALPFFTAMDEEQVDRVCEALLALLASKAGGLRSVT
jgi:dTDP-4-amino-4,6-dideoxygalactose transaminase